MANTFNGIGTTFYGQCAFEQDDSFITTKWFVLGFFPCAPLGSLRVRPLDSSGAPFLGRSTRLELIEELPLHWPQVLRTWAYVLFLILLAGKMVESHMPLLVKFAWVAVAAFIPLGLRAFAKWRQGHE